MARLAILVGYDVKDKCWRTICDPSVPVHEQHATFKAVVRADGKVDGITYDRISLYDNASRKWQKGARVSFDLAKPEPAKAVKATEATDSGQDAQDTNSDGKKRKRGAS